MADDARGDEQIQPGSAARVEHRVAKLRTMRRERVADADEALDDRRGRICEPLGRLRHREFSHHEVDELICDGTVGAFRSAIRRVSVARRPDVTRCARAWERRGAAAPARRGATGSRARGCSA
jgi:hypothetical protein